MSCVCVYVFVWACNSKTIQDRLLFKPKFREMLETHSASTTKPCKEQLSHTTVTSSGGRREQMSETASQERGTMTTEEKRNRGGQENGHAHLL